PVPLGAWSRSTASPPCITIVLWIQAPARIGQRSILKLVGQPDADAVRCSGRARGASTACACRGLQLQALGDVELDVCLRPARCALPCPQEDARRNVAPDLQRRAAVGA